MAFHAASSRVDGISCGFKPGRWHFMRFRAGSTRSCMFSRPFDEVVECGDINSGVVAKEPIDAGLEVGEQFVGGPADARLSGHAVGVRQPEVGREEVVLGAEGPRHHQDSGPMSVCDQRSRLTENVVGGPRNHHDLFWADGIDPASQFVKTLAGQQVGVGPRVAARHQVVGRATLFGKQQLVGLITVLRPERDEIRDFKALNPQRRVSAVEAGPLDRLDRDGFRVEAEAPGGTSSA